MRFWFDTEFIEDGHTIDLVSIGIIAEDGREYYAEPAECDLSRACDWVRENVFPYMKGRKTPRAKIAQEIVAFAGEKPEFWAEYAAYDWVAMCQLFGRMIDLPEGWPMFCLDVKQLHKARGYPALPLPIGNLHNALDDARACRAAWLRLT